MVNFIHILWGNCRNARDHSVYAPSQWETALHCNAVSLWLDAYTEWPLNASGATPNDMQKYITSIHSRLHRKPQLWKHQVGYTEHRYLNRTNPSRTTTKQNKAQQNHVHNSWDILQSYLLFRCLWSPSYISIPETWGLTRILVAVCNE